MIHGVSGRARCCGSRMCNVYRINGCSRIVGIICVCVCVGVRIRSVRRRVSRRHRITCRVFIMLVHNTRTVVVFMFVFLFVGFILTRVVPVLQILVCVLVVIGIVVIDVLILVALH